MSGESQREPRAEPDPTLITTQIIDKEISHLRELVQAKLDALAVLLEERDRGAREAVSAAFQSSEKAILKAEVSIEKRADATYVSLQELSNKLAELMPRKEAEARTAAQSDQITALIVRVERIEAVKAGGNERTADQRGGVAVIVGVAGVIIAALSLLAVVIIATR